MVTNLNFSFLFLLSACRGPGTWQPVLQDSRKAQGLEALGTLEGLGWSGGEPTPGRLRWNTDWLNVFRLTWGKKWGTSLKTGALSEIWHNEQHNPPPCPIALLGNPRAPAARLKRPQIRRLARGNGPSLPCQSLQHTRQQAPPISFLGANS